MIEVIRGLMGWLLCMAGCHLPWTDVHHEVGGDFIYITTCVRCGDDCNYKGEPAE